MSVKFPYIVFDGGNTTDLVVPGDGGNNTLYGGAASDTIYGAAGNDTLYGGAEADWVYGETGSDRVFGDAGDDTLYGGADSDSVFGGLGSDVFYAGSDDTNADEIEIVGWSSGLEVATITVAAGSNFSLDRIDGGSDSADPDSPDGVLGIHDVLVMDMVVDGEPNPDLNAPVARNVLTYTTSSGAVLLTNIEAIIATAGADLINLTYTVGSFHTAYDRNVLIDAGAGNDIVFAGDGYDTIIGDAGAATLAPGNDLLFGGHSDDIIYGDFTDFFAAAGGDDVLYGGYGDDTIYGGAGDDRIVDTDGGHAFGGLGEDLIGTHLNRFSAADHTIDGGPIDLMIGDEVIEDFTDGNDSIHVEGSYDFVHSSLGGGDDIYISTLFGEGGEAGPGSRTDIVFGGSGNDLIATNYGDDTLYGGTGDDVIWGGQNDGGGNIIYGGADIDVIYPGSDGNNHMYGGGQTDYYYWGMFQAGTGDQIYDQHRLGEWTDQNDQPQGALNYIVVFGAFDSEELPSDGEPVPDFLANGLGVFQTSHDLGNPLIIDDGENFFSDPILLAPSELEGEEGMWTLLSLYTGSSLTFDPNDIATIVLWNNDAASLDPAYSGPPGTPVMTFYNWDGTSYVYSLTPN